MGGTEPSKSPTVQTDWTAFDRCHERFYR